jgi:hypothetical protein
VVWVWKRYQQNQQHVGAGSRCGVHGRSMFVVLSFGVGLREHSNSIENNLPVLARYSNMLGDSTGRYESLQVCFG